MLVDPQLVTVAAADDDGPRTQDNETQAGEVRARSHDEEQQEEEETNKLAIVLADPQPQPAAVAAQTGPPKPHGDVESVLLALRRVKEQLRRRSSSPTRNSMATEATERASVHFQLQ